MTLELAGVTYRYPGASRPAMVEVELRIADGEIVGLVGANEAGKSTLCLVCSGMAPGVVGGTIGGTLHIDGASMADRAPHEVTERVGIGFQDPRTQLSGVVATVFEEVALGPMNLGLPVVETVARTRAALAALGIESLALRPPGQLSGGQGQRVALAALIAMRPRHLVLDEPTAQLDPAGAGEVASALRRLADGGTSLLVAEHRTDLLAALCDRVIALEGGRVVLDGPAATVLADERLPALGVDPPSRIRLERRLASAGLTVDPAELPA